MSSDLDLISDDLKRQYIQRRGAEIGTFVQALGVNDFESIASIGHRMRGNGSSFGFPELTLLGERIELAAQNQDSKSLQAQLTEFVSWVARHNSLGLPKSPKL